ncbi:hypothetical protein ACC771_02750 [Rhizobium ruizarguesonis]
MAGERKAATGFKCHQPVIFVPDNRAEVSTGIRPAAHPFAEPSPGVLVAPHFCCLGI